MCGIFGLINMHGVEIDIRTAYRSVQKMRHRGPDDEGYLLINSRSFHSVMCKGPETVASLQFPQLFEQNGALFNIILGHRRLSIIDLSDAGHQPMSSIDGRFWIVFNGEVYNYVELRCELEKEGLHFRSSTDTEVILAAYQQWGKSALKRFVGMFAFVIYDVRRQEIFMARDPFGIKPLYYTYFDGQFAFASEIKALIDLPGVTHDLNANQLYQYLRHGLTDGIEETLFNDIKELPGAHYMVVSLDPPFSASPTRYWGIDLSYRCDLSEAEAGARLRDLLEESVRLHLRSDVPLGSCLSGGLDSTAIVMLMVQNTNFCQEKHCFSFISDDPLLSEKKYVDIAQNAAGVVGHEVYPTSEELAFDLDRLIKVQELPFGGTSIYAQYRVFQLAREKGMKVMLDGQGSDEIFAGYYNYIGLRATGLITSGHPLLAWRALNGAPQNMKHYFFRMLLSAGGRFLPTPMIPLFRSIAQEPLWPSWMKREWFEERGVVARERPCGRGKNAFREELYLSLTRLSLPQLLRYEDRNSMCCSIESRVPFCFTPLAEFAFSLPDDLLIARTGTTKAVFKTAMRGIVPDAIVDREKIGFATPERQWLLAITSFVEKTMSEIDDKEMPFFCKAKEEVNRAIGSNGVWPAYAWRIFNLCVWNALNNHSLER